MLFKKRWSDRTKLIEEPLFKSYCFARFSFKNKIDVVSQSGVVNVVNFKGKYMPIIMGALTFFLPCGFTITAQGLALASGNIIQGSLIRRTGGDGTTGQPGKGQLVLDELVEHGVIEPTPLQVERGIEKGTLLDKKEVLINQISRKFGVSEDDRLLIMGMEDMGAIYHKTTHDSIMFYVVIGSYIDNIIVYPIKKV